MSIELKNYLVVIPGGAEPEIWTKNEYDSYTRKTLRLGACPAAKIVTHFNLEDSLLDETGQSSPDAKPLIEALEKIANPIKYLQDNAKQDGYHINGQMAIQLSNDPGWLKSIAIDALKNYQAKPPTNSPINP